MEADNIIGRIEPILDRYDKSPIPDVVTVLSVARACRMGWRLGKKFVEVGGRLATATRNALRPRQFYDPMYEPVMLR